LEVAGALFDLAQVLLGLMLHFAGPIEGAPQLGVPAAQEVAEALAEETGHDEQEHREVDEREPEGRVLVRLALAVVPAPPVLDDRPAVSAGAMAAAGGRFLALEGRQRRGGDVARRRRGSRRAAV